MSPSHVTGEVNAVPAIPKLKLGRQAQHARHSVHAADERLLDRREIAVLFTQHAVSYARRHRDARALGITGHTACSFP